MSIESSRLENGLTVYTDHMPGTHTGLVHVHVGVGGLEGPKRDAGKAHALEHALHLGTDEFIDAEAAEHFVDAHGFTTNAYTTNVQTAYHAQGERLDPLMRYLSQVMLHPTFPADAVAKEMSIIEEERLSSLTPETRHDMTASYALFGGSVARPIIGYRQPMFSADMLRDFWSRYYQVRAMAVVAVGAFSHEEVVASVEQYFDVFPEAATDKKRKALKVRINTASSGLILPRGESAYLTESLLLSRELQESFFSYDPAYRIAMDAMERWLSQEIREKRGLAYGSSLLLSETTAPGAQTLLAYTEASARNVRPIRRLHQQLFEIDSAGYSAELLRTKRAGHLGMLLRTLDGIEERSALHMDMLELGRAPVSIETLVEAARDVSIGEVCTAIDTIIAHASTQQRHTHVSAPKKFLPNVDRIIRDPSQRN